jgi:transcriptional regulator with XRE-family HTH domain
MERAWVSSPDYRALIEALAAIRQARGVSQREVARRIGKPPSFINKTELLERRLDVLEFIVIAEALDEKPEAMMRLLRANLPENLSL